MLKALVFLSVIVSLAYSAPYGSYSSSAVIDSGSSSLGGIINRIPTVAGLGEVHHGITERVVPLGTSNFIGSSVDVGSNVGVGVPLVEKRVLGSTLLTDSYGSHQEVVTQAPFIVQDVLPTQASYGSHQQFVEVATQAPLIVHETFTQAPLVVHETFTQSAYSAPVEVVTQAPTIVQEVVTQAAYSAPAPVQTIVHEVAPAPVQTIVHEASSYGSSAPVSIVRDETPVLHVSSY